ncbi:MAG: NAD(+)/NADH kinase [Lachnospiraceae bacterium]|nr:NAD(+)/NADH kinase [Lachnospiraceae bacterium]
MNKFFVITNTAKDPKFEFTNEIIEYLDSRGCVCYRQPEGVDAKASGYRYTNPDYIPNEVECAIVLGGDGTIIQASRDLCKREIPIFGVNIGTLGFLTDIEKTSVYPALDLVIEDKYEIDTRMMLNGKAYRDGNLIYENIALNDIVINRTGMLRVIDFDIFVNDEYLNSYSADGLIVATATGSTAYSLSAGGPIVQPNASMMLITPVCPHTLNKRSIILAENDRIELVMTANKGIYQERVASFDGEQHVPLMTGDKIVITKAKERTMLIKTNKISFLQVIRKKMADS